jgi:hypothetical protein
MNFLSKLTGLFSRQGGREGGKSDLQQNMEKALAMKQESGAPANIPEHQTAHEGGVSGQQFSMTDRDAGSQGSYQPQLKRSRVARSGDT